MIDLEHSAPETADTLTAEQLEGRNDWRGTLVTDTPLELASRYISGRMKAVGEELNVTGRLLPGTDQLRDQKSDVKTVITFLNSPDTADGSKKTVYPYDAKHLDPFMRTVQELAIAQRWSIVGKDPATLGKDAAATQEAKWDEQSAIALEERKAALMAKIDAEEDSVTKSKLEDLLLSLESGDLAMLES